MTTSYPPAPSRDPPPELPRRRNPPISTSTSVPGSSSNKSADHSDQDHTMMDSIKAKLPFTHEHEDGEDDSFDVIGYWAITAVCWYVHPKTLSSSSSQTTASCSRIQFGSITDIHPFLSDRRRPRTGYSSYPSLSSSSPASSPS